MAASFARHSFKSSDTLIEYGIEGCGVVADGGAGAAGHSQAGLGEFDAQAVRLAASSSGSSRVALGLLGSFMEGLVFLRLLARGFINGGLAGVCHGLGLLGLNAGDLSAQAPTLNLPGAGGGNGSGDQRGGGVRVHHASTCMPTWAPASVMVMTRFMTFSGRRVDTWTHCLPFTPSKMMAPMPSASICGASALATW